MTTQPVDSDLWAGLATVEEAPATEPVWEEPIPLTGRRELPAFPAHVFPAWLGQFVSAVAEETQTLIDLPGSIALSVLATAAGGRAVVHVRGNWREPTNLFVVCALPPANRKSAVFALLTDPLYEAEKQLKTAMAPAIVEAALTARLAREAADKAAVKAAGADGGKREELVAKAIGLAQTAESVAVPVEPLLMADDSTSETVTSLIAEQGGRLAVMSAEGGIFDIIAGRYSGAPNMEVFLKGHAGDRLRVNRQTRPYVFSGHGPANGAARHAGAKLVDVARRAGVSTGTVSNVLNRPDSVAELTRGKVETAIVELGYARGGS